MEVGEWPWETENSSNTLIPSAATSTQYWSPTSVTQGRHRTSTNALQTTPHLSHTTWASQATYPSYLNWAHRWLPRWRNPRSPKSQTIAQQLHAPPRIQTATWQQSPHKRILWWYTQCRGGVWESRPLLPRMTGRYHGTLPYIVHGHWIPGKSARDQFIIKSWFCKGTIIPKKYNADDPQFEKY